MGFGGWGYNAFVPRVCLHGGLKLVSSIQPSNQWMRLMKPATTPTCFASVAALDNGRGRVKEKQASTRSWDRVLNIAQKSGQYAYLHVCCIRQEYPGFLPALTIHYPSHV
jgi:hypothetical protein